MNALCIGPDQQKRVRAFVDKSTGVKSMADRKKRGPQKAMHDRLLQRLHASVYYDPTATNPTTGKPRYYLYDDDDDDDDDGCLLSL